MREWTIQGKKFTANKAVAFDDETTGFYEYDGDVAFAVVLYSDTGDCAVIRSCEDDAAHNLSQVLECGDVLKVGWNLQFDWRFTAATWGVELVWPWADAQVAMSLLDERAYPFRLKQCGAAYLRKDGKPMFPDTGELEVKDWLAHNRKQFVSENGREPNYSDVPWDIMDKYVRSDGKLTMYLWYLLEGGLKRENMMEQFWNEMRLVPALMRMQKTGMDADAVYLTSEMARAERNMNYQRKQIFNEVGWLPNFNSPLQVCKLLYDDLALECDDFTKGGKPSAGKQALKRHAIDCVTVRRIRRIKKLLAYNKIARQIIDGIRLTGYVHPGVNQTGTRTGRMSATAPPIQQMPREGTIKGYSIRQAFKTRDGYDHYHLDFKQVEMLDFADYSQDVELLRMLRAGEDVHTGTAKRVLHALGKEDEPSKHDRQQAKTLNFAIIYGAGDKTTMNTINADEDLERLVSLGETKHLRMAYLEAFPGINRLREKVASEIANHGRVIDRFGRVHRLGSDAWYKAINWLVQGGCGTLMKRAITRVDATCEWLNYNFGDGFCQQYITVHDEVGVRIRKELSQGDQLTVVAMIAAAFTADKDLFDAPLRCDVEKFNGHWGDLIDVILPEELPWAHPAVVAGVQAVTDVTGVTQWWKDQRAPLP